MKQADILAQSDYLRTEKLENLELWKKLYQEILEKKQCVSLKTLAVTGRDLIDTGMKPAESWERCCNSCWNWYWNIPSRIPENSCWKR